MKKIARKDFIRMSALTGLGIGLSKSLKAAGTKFNEGKRIGIIGLDTSHSTAFVKALNAAGASDKFKAYRIVAAYPKGSNDIQSSVERIPGYTAEVKQYGVEIVSSIPELIRKVDYVCLETNDGRLHLQQALPVIKAGKPLFIDKPITASLKDGTAIFDAARKYNTPVFSTSSLRYITGMEDVLSEKFGKVIGAETYSPANLEKTHPDLFWYGIHGVEMLFTAMGPDCKSVSRIHTKDTDIVVGIWDNDRIGSFRGTRSGKADYGGVVFAEKGNIKLGSFKGYNLLLEQIINFFETGKPPVAEKDTLAILAFMEAADESKKRKGASVTIDSIFKRVDKK